MAASAILHSVSAFNNNNNNKVLYTTHIAKAANAHLVYSTKEESFQFITHSHSSAREF